MFEKIPLSNFYVANYVDETLEYVYGGISKSTTVIHHFEVAKQKCIFILIKNQIDEIVGYMNLFDNKIYNPISLIMHDYEEVYDSTEDICDITNDGYANFEPLSNYNSKYIKPLMSIKLAKKAIYDINKQIEKEKIKSLIFRN